MAVECNECDLDDFEKSDLLEFAEDILFQIAAASPKYLNIENVPDDIIENIKNRTSDHLKNNYFLNNNHTERAELHIQRQISKGVKLLLGKFYEEECLFCQPWIKDRSKTIQNLVEEKSISLGKKISINRFERYELEKEATQKKLFVFDVNLESGIPLNALNEKCPNCGNRLFYVTYGSSYEILCETNGCYKKTYRGV